MARTRVSYVIPLPDEVPPRLQLPALGISRFGGTGPLLIPDPTSSSRIIPHHHVPHTRHRLSVSALALDTTTQLVGHSSPEGILYSGGHDGLVIAWDLGVKMRKKKIRDSPLCRWEALTGWGDDVIDEGGEEESDGDVIGDVKAKRKLTLDPAATEPQWVIDSDSHDPQPSTFRQSVPLHNEWINDILLCNMNQTVVSASSDGTIKSWNPHSSSEPSFIGTHADYVRCLAYCRTQNWVASGSFDRTIKLWDLSRSGIDSAPLATLLPSPTSTNPTSPENLNPKCSVYSIAADPFGRVVASGSPERVVRMWDPRSGKRTGKLVGHTDNIRAILMSEDSKYLLSGSADASIKLWSLAAQKCIHTFTHHEESVWALSSDHPSLDVFYSGDRAGVACRVDISGVPESGDIGDGECVVLCQNKCTDDGGGYTRSDGKDGINSIVAMDDHYMWTASANSTIKRWKIPQRRSLRAFPDIAEVPYPPAQHIDSSDGVFEQRSLHSVTTRGEEDGLPNETFLYGIPYASLVKLPSSREPFMPYGASYGSFGARGRDPEVATLYSAASVMSVPRFSSRLSHHPSSTANDTYTYSRPPTRLNSTTSPMRSSRTEDTVNSQHMPVTERLEYEAREVAIDGVPFCNDPDDVIEGDHGLVRCVVLNDRVHALTVDTSGEVSIWDLIRGICLGSWNKEDVEAASMRSGSQHETEARERSPREALEAVRERIEGEVIVQAWAKADTKSGLLTVHVNERCFESEVYADDVGFAHDRYFNDETKLNVGKWVLRNLFIGFIREEQRLRKLPSTVGPRPSLDTKVTMRRHSRHMTTSIVSSPAMLAAVTPTVATPISSSLVAPPIPINQSQRNSDDITPTPTRLRSNTLDSVGNHAPLATPQPATSLPKESADYFSVRGSKTMGGTPDEFTGWSGPASASTVSSPGRFMGRLKNFGKNKRPPTSEAPNPPLLSPVIASEGIPTPGLINITKTPVQALLAGPLSPPPSSEVPLHNMPSRMRVLISEEASTTPNGFTTVYQGSVGTTAYDTGVLEDAMPMWLIRYLLVNKPPTSPPEVKLSFVLLPVPAKDGEEALPELLNTARSTLTANRFLRVRKLTIHVQSKLEKISSSRAGSVYSSVEGHTEPSSPLRSPRHRAEEMYEILCNDALLPLDMTLATVRHYVWRQSGELVMHYRRKQPSQSVAAHL